MGTSSTAVGAQENQDQLSHDWFRRKWRQAKSQVGTRYQADLNVALPLSDYFSAACQEDEIFDRFLVIADDLESTSKKSSLQDLKAYGRFRARDVRRLESRVSKIIQELRRLSTFRFTRPTTIPLAEAKRQASIAERMLRRGRDHILETLRQTANDDEQERKVRSALYSIGQFYNELGNVLGYLKGPVVSPSNAPYLLILGSGGTGKTHLLSDQVERRVTANKPALLLLGQSLQSPFQDLAEAITQFLGVPSTPEEFFQRLSDEAVAQGTRCLICLDAVNEGHRQSLKKGLRQLTKMIRRHPGLALVISCRTPFEKLLVPSPQRLGLQVVHHLGFPPEQQTEAVVKYFTAYHIPIPEVPLLEEEFSNPLFLKLFCEAIEKVTVAAKHKQIRDIASGQKGMTHVLEFFVNQKDKAIRNLIGTPPRLSWKVLKDGIAKAMAEKHVGILRKDEALSIADNFQPAGMASGKLLQGLINEDILAEDILFESGAVIEGVRFSYQRFADHLIARHVLGTQLDTSNVRAIRRSLRDQQRLGVYLKDEETILRNAGLIQALLIEFPVRIQNRGELLDYLGWKSFPYRLCELFVDGLYWRDPAGINTSTGRWIGHFLVHEGLRDDTFNVLLALSVKPNHPLQARRLDAHLSRMPLPERDLVWSEYLRRHSSFGTPERILVWMENAPLDKLPRKFIEVYVKTTQWFLTSTMRAFRDRATHCLFRAGIHHPEAVFSQTLDSLSLNDPYVWSRMLGASYGITMALWRTEGRSAFGRETLPTFAKKLFRVMFSRGASHATTHILAREYAYRTIELALSIHPSVVPTASARLTRPPFGFGGIRRWGQSEDRDRSKYRDGNAPVHMDFENYTLGRLVNDRRNYDFRHKDYARVRRQVFWRIYNLGYSLDAFGQVDSQIAEIGWRNDLSGRGRGKIERYGKKYSWIAFYELAGYRHDRGLLPERYDERVSDVDIDPSFPNVSPSPPFFTASWIGGPQDLIKWMREGQEPNVEGNLITQEVNGVRGPWVLLDGFAVQTEGDKEVFAFLRGLLVEKKNLSKAQRILAAMDYPGNMRIPEPESEYYTYAGEIPWANTWHFAQYPTSLKDDNAPVEVFLPVREYAWESYHSTENDTGWAPFPSKELATRLDLYVQIPKITMADGRSRRVATQLISSGKDNGSPQKLLLIRQDLLDVYLDDQNLSLILFVWGERQGNYRVVAPDHVRDRIGDWRKAIHKQGFVYEAGRYRKFL